MSESEFLECFNDDQFHIMPYGFYGSKMIVILNTPFLICNQFGDPDTWRIFKIDAEMIFVKENPQNNPTLIHYNSAPDIASRRIFIEDFLKHPLSFEVKKIILFNLDKFREIQNKKSN